MRASLLLVMLAGALLFAPSTRVAQDADDKTTSEVRMDYLVICADSLKDSASDWADYRKAQGRIARVVTMKDIARVSDVDQAGCDEIRDFIKKASTEMTDLATGLQVLLVGDCPDEDAEKCDPRVEIPWFMTTQKDASPDPKRRSFIPTDNYYADVIQDDDGLPDIAVGRIPARDNKSVRTALAKVKAYEAAVEGEWLRDLTFFAGEGRFGEVVDGMLEKLFMDFADKSVPPAYDLRMTYANVRSSYAYVPRQFSDKVIEEANAGSLLLVYLGHGSYDRLDNMYVSTGKGKRVTYPILLGEDVRKFDIPDGKLPVMLIVACQTGYMDHPKGSLCERICFQDKAPVAVIASSRDSHPYSNTLLQKALVGEITTHRRATLGEAFLRTKRELILAEDPDRKVLETMVSLLMPPAERKAMNQAHQSLYNLTGDPGLRLRYPKLTLEHPEALVKGGDGTIEVSVAVPAELAEKLEWECSVEVARTAIAGELKKVEPADLASDEANKVKAAEEAIAYNHGVSNDKRAAELELSGVGMSMVEGSKVITLHFEGKPDPALAPGDYILKLSAREKAAKGYGFTGVRFTVKK